MDTKLTFDTNKIITICYPPYAGGKFLLNTLALSRGATFQDKFLADQDINNILENKNVYETKLKFAFGSLPQTKDDMQNWENYEYGCVQLFGWNSSHFCNFPIITPENANKTINSLIKINSINFFIVAHDDRGLKKVLDVFPNTKILLLKDFVAFLIIAKKLKNPKIYNEVEENIWKSRKYNNFIKSFSLFKIDYEMSYQNIFNEQKFLKEIENLYEKLGYDDFNKELVSTFYRAYIDLHK